MASPCSKVGVGTGEGGRVGGGGASEEDGCGGAREGTCISHVQTLKSLPLSIANEAPSIRAASGARRASAGAVPERLVWRATTVGEV